MYFIRVALKKRMKCKVNAKKINSKIIIKKMGIFILLKCNIQNNFKKLLHTYQECDACRLSVTLLTDIKLS